MSPTSRPKAPPKAGSRGAKSKGNEKEPKKVVVKDEDYVKEDTPPPPKKRKLPTIKKNKPPAQTEDSNSIATAPAASTPKPPPLTVPEKFADTVNPILNPPRKPPPKNDLDLRNPALYAELFKSGGGSALNRRERDVERRKELDRMRDEAKAKREAEAKKSFNLQEQAEMIAMFENRLRDRRSSAIYPNFLAASFKEEMERRKRKKEEQEEGEMV